MINVNIELSKFPTTRYYGSKRRLLLWIHAVTSELEFETVFDRFGGTSSVSLLFQSMGKKVIFHDALNFNTISANALLAIEPVKKDKVSVLFDEVKPVSSFITKKFKNIYYSHQENRWLDGAVQKLENHSIADNNAYWYCLFQACLKKRPFNTFHRANYYLRTADVKRNFGNLTTWNKSFKEHIDIANYELNTFVSNKAKRCQPAIVLPNKNLNNQYIDADLIYLDPPYIGNTSNTDNYHKKYHFLEGMTKYNDWHDLIDESKKIKSIKTPKHIEDWHDKTKFKDLLFAEIKEYRHKIVMLSYQTNGYPDKDCIYDFFVSLFDNVHIYNKPFSHALSKQEKIEIIIIGCPK